MRSLGFQWAASLAFLLACSSDTPTVPIDATTDTTTQDATTDAPVDVADAGPWSPKTLPNLVLWLDSDVGVVTELPDAEIGFRVVAWKDQSGNGNDAVAPTSGLPPKPGTSLGGHPSVRFAYTRLEIPDAPSLQFGTGDFALAVVGRHTTAVDAGVGYGFFLTKQNAASPFAGPALIGNDPVGNSVVLFQSRIGDGQIKTPTTGWNGGQAMLMVVTRGAGDGGAVVDLRLNGSSAATGSGAPFEVDLSATGRKLVLGDGPTGSQALIGDIAEVVAVKGSVTSQDVSKLEGYLKAKYGL